MARGGSTGIYPQAPAWELEEIHHAEEYPIVFTEVGRKEEALFYTAMIGQNVHIDFETGAIRAVEDRLYIINLTPDQANSRIYDGVAGFHKAEGVYFTLVVPSQRLLAKMDPALRWRFRLAFEYPRTRKGAFLVPTLSTSPFPYCFITEAERERIEHLCPPLPIARYIPEEFSYSREEIKECWQSEEGRQVQARQLHPLIESLFSRAKGDLSHYRPMSKELLPLEYRGHQLLYNAEMLGGW